MDKERLEQLKSIVEDVRQSEPMSEHTSFKLGGPADVMILPKTSEEILEVLRLVDKDELFVMGRGTNLLVTSKGIRKIVMKLADNFSGVEFCGTQASVKSGTSLSSLVRRCLEKKLGGIEFLGGIPGTLGGAVAMNAGAYGGEICDYIDEVVLASAAGIVTLSAEEMDFSYRSSVLNRLPFVVLEARLCLNGCDPEQSKCKISELNSKRRNKQPLEYPSAGSTFKRPEGGYAGALIEQAGLKGLRIGGAQVSEKHAGFIINAGGATPEDAINLIAEVQKRVKQKSGIHLVPEVKVVGEA